MATRAFILIETEVGKTRDVINTLHKVEGMKSVDMVTGPYDIIAVVEAGEVNAVGDIITKRIHTVPGISRTVTCIALKT